MDLDGDGTKDVVSGSYSPGDIFVFRGLGHGEYGARVRLFATDGRPARAGRASAVTVADWDRDGDLDLVVGNLEGEVSCLPQVGAENGMPVFGPTEILVERQQVQEDGWSSTRGDAGPLVADWDSDGIDDLLVGYGSGGVRWWRSILTADGKHVLAAPRVLVPSCHDDDAGEPSLAVKDQGMGKPRAARSRDRAKLAVTDWNGDGLADLLVGDVDSVTEPELQLSAAQEKERKQLELRRNVLVHRCNEVVHRIMPGIRLKLGLKERRFWSDDEDPDVTDKIQELLKENEEFTSANQELAAVSASLSTLSARTTTHGHVWVYLRRAATPGVPR